VTFRRADPTPDYRVLRLVSNCGRWELGLNDYQSGYRLRMGLSGRPPSLMDFCLGRDPQLCTPVLLAVLCRLENAAGSSSAEELDALFPWRGTRPDLRLHLELLLERQASAPATLP